MDSKGRFQKICVLDHGYVQFVESMGTEETIVEAARMSTGKGFERWDAGPFCTACSGTIPNGDLACANCGGPMKATAGDEKLLAFLYKHKHMTPFEMCSLHIEVMAPIMVYREWHRHRTQKYNEMSARYVPLPDLNYVATVDRVMVNVNTANKQAGVVAGAEVLTAEVAEEDRQELILEYARQEAFYQRRLKRGIPKELARCHLAVGRYSRMRAKCDLRNWLGFLALRMDPAAQWEIRQYANAVAEIIKDLWPRTFALFMEGRLA